MKAVILVDMPDDVSLDEWYAVKVIVDRLKMMEEEMQQGVPFDDSKTFKFVPLRPLPHSKQIENRWFSDDYSKGWNDCLAEIEAE